MPNHSSALTLPPPLFSHRTPAQKNNDWASTKWPSEVDYDNELESIQRQMATECAASMAEVRKAYILIHGPLRTPENAALLLSIELIARVAIHQSGWHTDRMDGTTFTQVITAPQEAYVRHVVASLILSCKGHLVPEFNWSTRDKKHMNKLFGKDASNKINWDAPEFTSTIKDVSDAVVAERLRLRKGELVDFVETVFDVSDYITPTTAVVDGAAPLDDTAADSIIAGLNFDHSDSDSDSNSD